MTTSDRSSSVGVHRGRTKTSVAFTAAVLGILAASAPAVAFEPIEGVWRTEGSSQGAFLVQQKAPGAFRKVTIQGNRNCVGDEFGFYHLVGDETEVRGGGLDYSYTPQWRTNGCAVTGTGIGIYRVISARPSDYRLAACAARPGTGAPRFDAAYRPTAPNTHCNVAVRIREPVPPVTLSSFAAVPRMPRCTRRVKRHGRNVKVQLRNQANEPVLALEIRLGRRVVYRYDYPGKLAGTVTVRLPARGSRLWIGLKTTSNKLLLRARRSRRGGRG